jgi:hypothetical protein
MIGLSFQIALMTLLSCSCPASSAIRNDFKQTSKLLEMLQMNNDRYTFIGRASPPLFFDAFFSLFIFILSLLFSQYYSIGFLPAL